MIEVYAQFDKAYGPSRMGEHKLIFNIQKEHAKMLLPFLLELNENPQCFLHIEIVKTQVDANRILQENNNKLRLSLNRKIHALFDRLAIENNSLSSEYKSKCTLELKQKGWIKESLGELTVEHQEEVIKDLERRLA